MTCISTPPPESQWKLIAFWAIPSGEQTNIAASPKQGPVVDHFDSLKVLKLYTHLFGERTGLQPYFGNPMRAVFNDSHEFKANRHYSNDFIAYFKKKRGYDITPCCLPTCKGGTISWSTCGPMRSPDFSFSGDYVCRTQYALRAGKPHTDVLIYYPFTNVEQMPDNPQEIFTKGFIEGVEGPLPQTKETTNPKAIWAEKVYPLINQLEAGGITWEWVNDASIQEAKLEMDGHIDIRGNRYPGIDTGK